MSKLTLTDFTDYERTVLLWGLTVTFGYLTTYFYSSNSSPVWILLILVNIANYLSLDRSWTDLDLNLLWMVMALLALSTIAYPGWQIYALLTIGVAGFYYTGRKLEGTSKRIYLGAALLNVFVAVIYLIAPSQIEEYLLLAFVQGAPMLVDYFVE